MAAVALVTMVSLPLLMRRLVAAVVELALLPSPLVVKAGVVTHIAMALLPSMRRVFAIVVIAFFALMTMALLPLSMHRRPCRC